MVEYWKALLGPDADPSVIGREPYENGVILDPSAFEGYEDAEEEYRRLECHLLRDGAFCILTIVEPSATEGMVDFVACLPLFLMAFPQDVVWERLIPCDHIVGVGVLVMEDGTRIYADDVMYTFDRWSVRPAHRFTTNFSGLALTVTQTQPTDILVQSGPMLELGSTIDTDGKLPQEVTLSTQDMSYLLRKEGCQYSYYGTVEDVISVEELQGTTVYVCRMSFHVSDSAMLRICLHMSEHVLDGHVPAAGDVLHGRLWLHCALDPDAEGVPCPADVLRTSYLDRIFDLTQLSTRIDHLPLASRAVIQCLYVNGWSDFTILTEEETDDTARVIRFEHEDGTTLVAAVYKCTEDDPSPDLREETAVSTLQLLDAIHTSDARACIFVDCTDMGDYHRFSYSCFEEGWPSLSQELSLLSLRKE